MGRETPDVRADAGRKLQIGWISHRHANLKYEAMSFSHFGQASFRNRGTAATLRPVMMLRFIALWYNWKQIASIRLLASN
jgi:hypothetical protein